MYRLNVNRYLVGSSSDRSNSSAFVAIEQFRCLQSQVVRLLLPNRAIALRQCESRLTRTAQATFPTTAQLEMSIDDNDPEPVYNLNGTVAFHRKLAEGDLWRRDRSKCHESVFEQSGKFLRSGRARRELGDTVLG
jgi:hypothetical protein